MSTEKTTKPPADLRWPNIYFGLIAGFFILLFMSIVMAVLYLKYPGANGNPWLVLRPDGFGPFQKSITAIATTHFFHGNGEQLWTNLGGLWFSGMLAYALSGPVRATKALIYGGLLSGLILLFVGSKDSSYMGCSTLVFAFIGLILPAVIRKGTVLTVAMLLVLLSFAIADNFISGLMSSVDTSSIHGNVWLAYLGALIGGIMAELNNPTEAVRVLHRKGIINDRATEALLRQTCWALYDVEDSTVKSPSDQILDEEELRKQAVDDAVANFRKEYRKKEARTRAEKLIKEREERAKQQARDEKFRKKQELKDAKVRAKAMTKEAKSASKQTNETEQIS